MSLDIHHDLALPEFAIGLRGYDRAHVDEYIARAMARMSEAQDRAELAEARIDALEQESKELRRRLAGSSETVSPGPFSEAGERVEAIVQRAIDEARSLVERAQQQANAAYEMARASAADIVIAARDLAADLERQAANDRRAAADELARMVSEAEDGRSALIGEAEKTAAGHLAAAERRATALMDDAQDRAAAIALEAESQAARMCDDAARAVVAAEERCRDLEADVERLLARRRHVLGELTRLGQGLGSLVGADQAPPGGPAEDAMHAPAGRSGEG